jgi:pimeloyl-ACP methyl ester carboxylesterase
VELVGHDWRGALSYDACVTAPDRIKRAVTLAFPHPLTFLSRPRLAQLRLRWYMGLFQLPGSGWMVSARDLALIDRLWRQWSPGLALDPSLQAELHEHLRASMPAALKILPGAAPTRHAWGDPPSISADHDAPAAAPRCRRWLHPPPAGRRPTSVRPPRTRWRSSPTSVTSCTSRPPRRSRNGSRCGPVEDHSARLVANQVCA